MEAENNTADEAANQPTEERIAVLGRLKAQLGDVPPHFWAASHFCDIQALELLVRVAELSPQAVHIVAAQSYSMVLAWSQSITSLSAATTPERPSSQAMSSSPVHQEGASDDEDTRPRKRQKRSLTRSKSALNSALKRDNGCCVLTGHKIAAEVAHIYPICLMQKEEDIFGKRHIFWQMLRNFFPQEEISTWEAIIFPNGTEENGLESAQNMITLSSDAHKLWNHGAFALKPISVSEDKMSLTLQFFWQKKQFQTMPVTSVDNVPPCTRDLDHYMEAKLANVHSEDFITSGQFFKMTTDDPVSRPLPNMALLHMQWFLQRVMGLAGAADFPPDLGDYFSDGEVSNLGLEEAGEESFLSSLSGPSVATVPDIASPPHPLLETPKHQGDEIQRFGDVQV